MLRVPQLSKRYKLFIRRLRRLTQIVLGKNKSAELDAASSTIKQKVQAIHPQIAQTYADCFRKE
jgi:hypothetical protein